MTNSDLSGGKAARRSGIAAATVTVLIALPILLGLGFWQLERLAWKESLVAAIAERTKQAPSDLIGTYSATHEGDLGFEYMRVKVRGRFVNDKERYFYAPDPTLGPGYNVYTPLEIAGTTAVVFVNRGFVPEDRKDPAKRRQGQIEGETEVVGLLRGVGQKGTFTPENDVKANLWFWRDYAALFASAFEGTDRTPIAAFLDAEAAAPGGWPKGGATLVDLPNRHLEYALTWFGLAATLVAVFGAFVWARLRSG